LISQDPAKEGALAIDTLAKYIRSGKSSAGIDKTVTLPNIILDTKTPAADLDKYTYVQNG
jgi:hypothetical protein